jgi:hypothetical protein
VWLLSPSTALPLLAALVGAALVAGLTGLPPIVAVLVGGAGAWILAVVALAPVADRMDAALHRMGGPRRRR